MNYLSFIDAQFITILTQLAAATFLGMLLGVERTMAHKTAGMRTYALMGLGSALFVIISDLMSRQYVNFPGVNPLFLPAQIIVGVGFIGGGLIFVHGHSVKGLTTAAGLWVTAGIGMAIGFKLYALAVLVTFLTLFIFTVLWRIEDKIKIVSGISGNECTIDITGKAICNEDKQTS